MPFYRNRFPPSSPNALCASALALRAPYDAQSVVNAQRNLPYTSRNKIRPLSGSIPERRRLVSDLDRRSHDRVDFIKVDVEGFELEVFEGGRQVLNDFKPIALLEMNHWCLNVFRRISIPAFRERLLSVFPFLYAVDGSDFVDFGDERNAHRIFHAHLIEHRFANLVAGFDRDDLVSRLAALRGLDSLQPTSPPQTPSPQEEAMRAEIERLKGSIAELEKRLGESSSAIEAFKRSTSWKVTAPIRAVVRAFR